MTSTHRNLEEALCCCTWVVWQRLIRSPCVPLHGTTLHYGNVQHQFNVTAPWSEAKLEFFGHAGGASVLHGCALPRWFSVVRARETYPVSSIAVQTAGSSLIRSIPHPTSPNLFYFLNETTGRYAPENVRGSAGTSCQSISRCLPPRHPTGSYPSAYCTRRNNNLEILTTRHAAGCAAAKRFGL